MMTEPKNIMNIMIVGVGGQGTLLASKLIGAVCQSGGFDVKVSEVHGMSQRGGSVVTYVRYGESVASPVIERGEADIMLAFELLEAARYLPYLKKDGMLILNNQKIDPMPVITGATEYPDNIAENLGTQPIALVQADAAALARQAGSVKAVNIALIGILAKHTDFDRADWEKAITETVPVKFMDLNLKAFELGYNFE